MNDEFNLLYSPIETRNITEENYNNFVDYLNLNMRFRRSGLDLINNNSDDINIISDNLYTFKDTPTKDGKK